jgi:hypothetical protein
MDSPDPISAYITDRKSNGFSDQAIIDELVSNGWEADQASQVVASQITVAAVAAPKSRIVLFTALASVLMVVVAGAVYWFVFKPTKMSPLPTNNQNQSVVVNNIQLNTASPRAATFAQVFGTAVSREEFDRYKRYIDMIPDSDSFIAVPSFEKDPVTTVSTFLEPYVYLEAIKRLGGTPGTLDELAAAIEQSITPDQKAGTLEQVGLPAESWSDFVRYQLLPERLQMMELPKVIGDEPSAVFKDLAQAHVEQIRVATEHRIVYLKVQDRDFTPKDFDAFDHYGQADYNYLNKNFGDDLVADLPLPSEIKNFLLQNRSNTLVVSPVVEENGYHIFGFVIPPIKGLPVPEKFTKDDIVALRFPWAEQAQSNGEYAVSLLWENGVEQGNITLTKQSGLVLPAVERLIDYDSDGLMDYVEGVYGSRSEVADTDADGKTDKQEYDSGTDPLKV